MKARTKRRLIDLAVFAGTYLAISYAGAGPWALLIFPYGLWNYYDGQTRSELSW